MPLTPEQQRLADERAENAPPNLQSMFSTGAQAANRPRTLQQGGWSMGGDVNNRNRLQGDFDYINNRNAGRASGTPASELAPHKTAESYANGDISTDLQSDQNARADANKGSGDFDYDAAMQQWESIFGDDNKKAYAAGQDALNGQLSANTRRQQEMSAMSGRSTMGGGYQAGAAQAALSGGTTAATFETNFYNNQQKQKQSFLEKQLSIAQRNGELDKANQIELAIAKLGLLADIGTTEADTEFLDNTERD